MIFNQRSIEEIFDVILAVGRLVNRGDQAQGLVDTYRQGLDRARTRTADQSYRPRVYFEEWDEPIITGSQWVSELIAIAGGEDIFQDRSSAKASLGRGADWAEVVERQPELMVASWCGKPLERDVVQGRPGAQTVPALNNEQLHEMDPAIILQPGPAALTDGLATLESLIRPLAS